MPEEMAKLLMSYYRFSAETAREILGELKSTDALAALTAGYLGARVAQRQKFTA